MNGIEIGKEYKLSDLWDGEFGEITDILESGCVSPDEENIISFEIVEECGIDSILRIRDIY